MHIPSKKLNNGFELPVYGLGLWEMGGRMTADTTNDGAAIKIIETAIDAGISHIDTAEIYGAGHAEELLGTAIKGHSRHRLIITTKVAPMHQSYDGVRRACESSLRRMGVDYIDLYLLHHPSRETELTGPLRAMDELIAQGLIKNIGVCNVTPARFALIQQYTKNPLVCNQVHYNVQYREAETRGVLKDCQEHDRMLIAWRPLQKGALIGAPLLDELAQKYAKTPAQIAINWLVAQKNVVTLSKTSSLEHLMENLGALSWQMDNKDIEQIRQHFPHRHSISDVVPLYDND